MVERKAARTVTRCRRAGCLGGGLDGRSDAHPMVLPNHNLRCTLSRYTEGVWETLPAMPHAPRPAQLERGRSRPDTQSYEPQQTSYDSHSWQGSRFARTEQRAGTMRPTDLARWPPWTRGATTADRIRGPLAASPTPIRRTGGEPERLDDRRPGSRRRRYVQPGGAPSRSRNRTQSPAGTATCAPCSARTPAPADVDTNSTGASSKRSRRGSDRLELARTEGRLVTPPRTTATVPTPSRYGAWFAATRRDASASSHGARGRPPSPAVTIRARRRGATHAPTLTGRAAP